MNAIVAREPAPISEAAALIAVIERAATNPDVDVEKMRGLIDLREHVMAKVAEAQFNEAMTAAQAEMGPISADGNNPQTHSKYATYAKLDTALRPIYTKNGFSISYDTTDSPKDEHIRVLAYAARGGFTRTYRVDMPADGKGAKGGDVMTKTHAAGSAMSYGMRYLLKMIFNVAVGEEDDDGNKAANKPGREPTGRPQDGMRLQDFPGDRQLEISAWARDIKKAFADGDTALAAKTWKDCDLCQEEKTACWGELDSHTRTSLKKFLASKGAA